MEPLFGIDFTRTAANELKPLRAFDQRRIIETVEQQLSFQPLLPTRNRKPLNNPQADFEFTPPLWELRCGTFRVFYDVDSEQQVVYVRAVREKPLHHTSDEIL